MLGIVVAGDGAVEFGFAAGEGGEIVGAAKIGAGVSGGRKAVLFFWIQPVRTIDPSPINNLEYFTLNLN